MRVLHVAAMAFPAPRGTQAAVHSMVETCARAPGSNAALLTYADGGEGRTGSYGIFRCRAVPGAVSVRSGPSTRKLAADALLAAKIPSVLASFAPDVVLAHHVEAGAVALVRARRYPCVFVAHTSLGIELPVYFGPAWRRPASLSGRLLDRALVSRADAAAAVSPGLARELGAAVGRAIDYLPVPWRIDTPASEGERIAARDMFGFAPDDRCLLYCGNLDAYQGWEACVAVLARLRATHVRALLLVATACDTDILLARAQAAGVGDFVRVAGIPDEVSRRNVHAAADVALVPRRVPGGVPVKLLDSLARHVPTLATARACADLPLGDAVVRVADDDAQALAAGASRVLASPTLAGNLRRAGADYLGNQHGKGAFLDALCALVDRAASRQQVKIPARDR